MNKYSFIEKVIKMLESCQCKEGESSGFKLEREPNEIISVVNTTQALLIMEKLFGRNFIYNENLKNFDFKSIKNFFINKKDYYLNCEKSQFSSIKINDISFCAIGLNLLGENLYAEKLCDLLLDNKINRENAWGFHLASPNADILQTYYVTMLLNRLHKKCVMPQFVKDILKKYKDKGVPYTRKDKRIYIESLTLIAYMEKYYYHTTIKEDYLNKINIYYTNKFDSISHGYDNSFNIHPFTQWRLFCFGKAACVLLDIKNPFYAKNGHYILENLDEDCMNNCSANIPYVLELCMLYNAIKDRYDPFHGELVLDEISDLDNSIKSMNEKIELFHTNALEYINNVNIQIKNLNIKIPIGTCLIFIYFTIIFCISFIIINLMISYLLSLIFEENHSINTIIIKIFEIIISVFIPFLTFLNKKIRKFLIKIIDFIVSKLGNVENV